MEKRGNSIPLRTVVHGNCVAQQSGDGDEMDGVPRDKTHNLGGPGSSVWFGMTFSALTDLLVSLWLIST